MILERISKIGWNIVRYFPPTMMYAECGGNENKKYYIFSNQNRTHNLLCLQSHDCAPALRLAIIFITIRLAMIFYLFKSLPSCPCPLPILPAMYKTAKAILFHKLRYIAFFSYRFQEIFNWIFNHILELSI